MQGEPATIEPHRLPPQLPPANDRVANYIEEATSRSADAMRETPAIRYRYGDAPNHFLDVYTPAETQRTSPALIFFHGGAWITGYPWWNGFMAPGVHAAGGVLISPAYRLAPGARFPAQLEDATAAIRWVLDHAEAIGVDRNRIVLGGHSAGGHVAALTALHPDARTGLTPKSLRAVFAVSSPFNLHYPNAAPGSGEERVYKHLLRQPADDHGASPITYARADAPPFHISFGERDFDRISRNSLAMRDTLASAGARVTCQTLAGMDHFDTHLALGDPANPWFEALRQAFNKQ